VLRVLPKYPLWSIYRLPVKCTHTPQLGQVSVHPYRLHTPRVEPCSKYLTYQHSIVYICPPCAVAGKLCLTLYGHIKMSEQWIIIHVIGTLVVDGWAITFGTARRAWAGCGPAQSPPHCTKCNSPPINGQCTNFILFDVAL